MKILQNLFLVGIAISIISCKNEVNEKRLDLPKSNPDSSTEKDNILKSVPKSESKKTIKKSVVPKLEQKKTRATDTLKPISTVP